ncbi:hypothetical protein SAMN04488055_0733 [Chitinophaga niabensis]|uniref:Uncharacterized protein n=2 Tax=Chitinophaga niabensis TaxID=536979 RepID=A0A1N6DGP6_9BACT|nr:hypothetical protein SAMN04488055_0733 [Chitinophaga niabensis]
MLLLAGCSTMKRSNVIPYVVDLNTEKSIYNEILRTKEDIAFFVEHLSDETLKFHLATLYQKEFIQSNRKLFINDKFYPIVFDSDYWFYSKIKANKPVVTIEERKYVYKEIPMPSIQEREKSPHSYGYPKKISVIDHSIYWIVDKKGKLIKTNSIPESGGH